MLRFAKRLLPSLAAAGILITIGGCADVPTAPANPPADAQYTAIAAPHGIAAGAASTLIGIRGGIIEAGGHRIEFPSGAVLRPTVITMQPMTGRVGVVFSPHGLVFPADAQPKLTVDVAGIDLSTYSALALVYEGPDGPTGETFHGELSADGAEISTRIPHFSGYFVAGS